MDIKIFIVIILICFGILLLSIGDTRMFVLLLIFSIAFISLFVYRNISLKKTLSKVPENKLHVLNLDKGGVLRLTGVGDSCEEINLKVLAKHLYRQGDCYWYELECDKGDGEKVWVEVEDDDETKVSIVLEKLTLPDIKLTPFRLADIDENESGRIKYNGKNFSYSDSDEATFYKFCDDAKAEKFYYWDFKHRNYSISVERWSKREYEVFYSQTIKPYQVTVYLNKEEGDI